MELRVAKSGDFLKPIIEFASDAHGAEEDLKEKDTQPRRRAYIRALFAMIEGSMYFLKQTCLSASLRSGNPGRLSVGELAILDERTFDLSPNGTVTDQPKFLRTLANVRFLHLMLGRVFRMSLDLGVGTQRWEEFSQAITVRNRITHPKSLGEFEISDE